MPRQSTLQARVHAEQQGTDQHAALVARMSVKALSTLLDNLTELDAHTGRVFCATVVGLGGGRSGAVVSPEQQSLYTAAKVEYDRRTEPPRYMHVDVLKEICGHTNVQVLRSAFRDPAPPATPAYRDRPEQVDTARLHEAGPTPLDIMKSIGHDLRAGRNRGWTNVWELRLTKPLLSDYEGIN